MFQSASVFNADISGWNTASVLTMNNMFGVGTSSVGNPQGACAFSQDVSGWNVARVKDMTGVFGGTTGSAANPCASCPPALKRAISDSWGPLIRAQYPAWGRLPCIKADVEPMDGSSGTCTATLPFSAACNQTCDAGYASKAPLTCTESGLTGGGCDPCAPGRYCPSGSLSGQLPLCPAGYVCPVGTSDQTKLAMPCEARFYCPAGTSPASRRDGLCLAGFYCPSGTPAGSSFPCPAGAYCEEGSKDPTPCPIGTFQSELGAVSAENCTKCPLGTYGTHTLSTSPQACVACAADRPLTKRTGAESESECHAADVCSQTALAVRSARSNDTGAHSSS